MKKFFTNAVAKITFYALLAALLFAVTTGAGSLLRVVAAAYWVIVLLGAVVGLLALIITFGVEYSKDDKSRREGIEYLERFAKRKNAIARLWGWFCLVPGAGCFHACIRWVGIYSGSLRNSVIVCAPVLFACSR